LNKNIGGCIYRFWYNPGQNTHTECLEERPTIYHVFPSSIAQTRLDVLIATPWLSTTKRGPRM
jgi:hypothetical protein